MPDLRPILGLCISLQRGAIIIIALCCVVYSVPARAQHQHIPDASLRQTFALYEQVPCLTNEERTIGKEILRGLNYNDQRVFRKMCLLYGIDFTTSREAWAQLLVLDLSYEHILSFERWAELEGVDMALALNALPEIKQLTYEAGKTFRDYLQLPRVSPEQAIQTIAFFVGMKDENNRAMQAFLSIEEMDAEKALQGFMMLAQLTENQARACETFASLADMTPQTMLDALPLLRQLHQDSAWNARNLFAQEALQRQEAWKWLISYFALPSDIQENQYYSLQPQDRQQLLHAFYTSGEEVIWRINNLHAITDHFGFEISSAAQQQLTTDELQQRFARLSPTTRSSFGHKFYPLSAGSKSEMINILRTATAADRRQTAIDLTSANIYALLAQGSELYDSSFRDILVPVLQKRISLRSSGNLLTFLQEVDPENMLVSSFIVSLAQKGKLTIFFPADNEEQKKILSLVAKSAFQDEDSILLFSATFIHLLSVLEPDARSFLIKNMCREADDEEKSYTRLIRVILQYYLQEYPHLLGPDDRLNMVRTIIRHGTIDLDQYLTTPFREWKSDGRLGSVSVFHPDDDGRSSFYSNARLLHKNGYRAIPCGQYTPTPLPEPVRNITKQLIDKVNAMEANALPALFRAMETTPFSIAFEKKINNLTIRHALYVYSGEGNQQLMFERFLKGGDEMFAQRGHSYWRSEQITDPLEELLHNEKIGPIDLKAKQRFLSLGSCGGVKAYTRLMRLFRGHIDILATIGTGLAMINDPYNRHFFEIVALNEDSISWKRVTDQAAFIFQDNRGRDYIQPGSLTAILHKIIDQE